MDKIKKPKNGHYCFYCFECNHWKPINQIGMVYNSHGIYYITKTVTDGYCYLIEDEPTNREAYSPPCDLWKSRK